jgi:hypothetical protein
MSRAFLSLSLGALFLSSTACTVDSTNITTSSGTGGESSTSATSTDATSGSGGATTTAATGGAGTGGATTAGTGGSGTGGSAECPPISIVSGVLAECTDPGPLALSASNTTLCPADTSVAWPVKFYEIQVTAGDCVHMEADNAGSVAGADLFGSVVDPNGHSVLFDEEMDCTVPNPDNYKCPSGGATIEMSGTAYIVVGSWEGAGCPAGDSTPFQVRVSKNGADVALGAELCQGDLQQIIQ